MKVPLSWLRDYVDFNDTPKGLADRLTFSGTEVEAIETVGGTYDGVVVGEILKVERHPNANKLTLCTVNTGSGDMVVVCGAPNAAPGLKAPFAPAGVTLPNGLVLKTAKIRGVESHGMLCAEDELKISDDHTGLMVVDPKWAPGTPLSKVMGPPETVLELEITPNRPDCLSIIGIAREVAALYGTKLRWPEVRLPEAGDPVEQLTRVEIEDPEGCPRYTARILKNVKIGPSPDWMKRRLELSGIRAISNVVDITNYVMLECGQPLHAFDQSLLEEGRIVVRRVRPGEKMATLDGIDRPLAPSMLAICDAKRPVAIAGIMGGAGSEIHDHTGTVLLESAYFKPDDNRATSKKLGLSTESSYRFERGIDIGRVEWASRRAAMLMVELGGATCAPGVIDAFPRPRAAGKVACRIDRMRTLLGLDVSGEQAARVLQSLELPVVQADAELITVDVPSFRVDLEQDVDLVEEFARIHGLDKIPAPPPRAEVVPGADDRPVQAVAACRACLVGLGLREVMNYSLVSEQLLDQFDAADAARRLVLPNPVSADQGILRTHLAPQMVETLGRNLARQISEAGLFEMGRVYFIDAEGRPAEENRVAVGLMGPVGRTGPERHRALDEEEMFLWVKGIWESLAKALNVGAWSQGETSCAYMEAGRAASILVGGEAAGVVGLVRGDLRRAWRMAGPVGILELRLAPILAGVFARKPFAPLAQFPSISRDAALIVAQNVRHEQIMEVVRRVAPKELERIELFDIFSGAGIAAGKKSLAYSFTYRSLTRTLTDDEANGFHESVKDALKRELGVDIREG